MPVSTVSSAVPAYVPANQTPATQRQGAKGPAVRELQALLKAKGFDPGAVDGSFGPKTAAAVKRFQQAAGIGADGVVGPKTWAKLMGSATVTPNAPVGSVQPASPGTRAPLEAFPIAGTYSSLRDNFNPKYENGQKTHHGHHGIDIYSPAGTPVVAPGSGTVIKAGFQEYSGNTVVIRRADGTTFYMCHLGSIPSNLRPGQQITAGTPVGTVGHSGKSANGVNHLHFSMYRGSDYYDSLNPYPYLVGARDAARPTNDSFVVQ